MGEMTWEQVTEKLSDLKPFIAYLENTGEDEWQVNVVRNKGNTRNCMFGHLVNWFYGKDWEGNISPAWDWFEEMWSTSYQIYPINDGQNPRYQQATPKQRVVAYLKNLWLGLEMDTNTGMEYQMNLIRERESAPTEPTLVKGESNDI